MDPITGSIQDYAWGSTTAIPRFLGRVPDGRPQAELWLGAHPVAPSLVGNVSLLENIDADPLGVVGKASVARFGPRLPYLMKVLAAAQPLSLQAHPSRAQAEVGFWREEEAGLDRSAPTRLFRDDWPKPEMMVALGDVEALCGFREPHQTFELFTRLGARSATTLVDPLRDGGPDQLAEVLGRMLRLGHDDRDVRPDIEPRQVVGQVVAAAAQLLASAGDGSDADLVRFARTAVELEEFFPGDPGVLAALLMNRLTLRRFDGLFLPAGNLHAYLHGMGVEIMANSDNVMRGGLTPKHVDVSALLEVLDFTPGVPTPVEVVAEAPSVWRYLTPAPEFALWRVDAGRAGIELPAGGRGRIVLIIDGRVEIADGTLTRRLDRGGSVFGYPGETLTVTGSGTVMVGAPGV